MSHYLRLYQSAVDPADVTEMRRLFLDDLRPIFTSCDGCMSMELLVNVDTNAGGLVEGAAVSRWSSLEAMRKAVSSRAVEEAIVRVRSLLRQEPVAKVFEILE
jgi:quinol monooxygenase YgiN